MDNYFFLEQVKKRNEDNKEFKRKRDECDICLKRFKRSEILFYYCCRQECNSMICGQCFELSKCFVCNLPTCRQHWDYCRTCKMVVCDNCHGWDSGLGQQDSDCGKCIDSINPQTRYDLYNDNKEFWGMQNHCFELNYPYRFISKEFEEKVKEFYKKHIK